MVVAGVHWRRKMQLPKLASMVCVLCTIFDLFCCSTQLDSNRNKHLLIRSLDSKVLKEQQRDKFFGMISAGVLNEDIEMGHRLHVSSPAELSGKMLRM